MRNETRFSLLVFLLVTLCSSCWFPAPCSVSGSVMFRGVARATTRPVSINEDGYACSSGVVPQVARGGDVNNAQDLTSAENTILGFLESLEKKGKFYIQGWRWHTMSLLRDVGRMEKLAWQLTHKPILEDDQNPLEQAAHHVVDFNMKGLHRIEDDLFFPWLRKKLTMPENKEVSEAFATVVDQLDDDRQKIAQLGVAVKDQAKIASKPTVSEMKRFEAIRHVAQLSAALMSKTREVMEREERLIVPAVASLVPEKEQKSFNSKVIRKLGILDSRLHLVGMHDAVWEHEDKSERDLFDESIPYIPRRMIPRWKRNLYEPQAGVLDDTIASRSEPLPQTRENH